MFLNSAAKLVKIFDISPHFPTKNFSTWLSADFEQFCLFGNMQKISDL